MEGLMIFDNSSWSMAADYATKQAFHMNGLGLLGDVLHLKHRSGAFGAVNVATLSRDKIDVCHKTTGQTTRFGTIDELIHAGWTLD
jgi:hypothetical protein